MLETLADLMFGTPKRFRTSIYAFWIIGAIILTLAAQCRPYRRTILTFGAVLMVLYAQVLFAAVFTPDEVAPVPPTASFADRMEATMMQLRAVIPWLVVIAGPLALLATFISDHTNNRVTKILDSRRGSRKT